MRFKSRVDDTGKYTLVALVVAEKPSVARDLARVLKATKKKNHWWEGEHYRVTWSVGHLVRLSDPHELRPGWKKWRLSDLPVLPSPWTWQIIKETAGQFRAIKKLLNSDETTEIICATDAGREGEHIFRLILEKAGCSRPFRRLWISSLTPAAIRKGMESLRDSQEFENLAASAKARSQADWLTGINLSRLYSLKLGETVSIGRVQTPTLEMLVSREDEIQNFNPEPFREVKAVFSLQAPREPVRFTREGAAGENQYEGWYLKAFSKEGLPKDLLKARRLTADQSATRDIMNRLKSGTAEIHSLAQKPLKQPPPRFYDLTELQRHANRLFHFPARQTLDIAQTLYEEKKAITYPRTDCRFLSEEEAKELPAVVESIEKPYQLLLTEDTGKRPLGKNWVNSDEVKEHHAIIPTGNIPTDLSPAQAKIFDLICRRLLAAWQPPYRSETTTVITKVTSEPEHEDFYYSRGTIILQKGWKVLEEDLIKGKGPGTDPELPAELTKGKEVWPVSCFSRKGMTRPPPPLNEAALLTGMESAGKKLEESDLAGAMEGKGLGTPATRAGIIETLKERGFVKKENKALRATEKGVQLIRNVHADLKSPRLTGEWESLLNRVSQGTYTYEDFMDKTTAHLKSVISSVLQEEHAPDGHLKTEDKPGVQTVPGEASTAQEKLSAEDVLKSRFGLAEFRFRQKEVCESLIRGENALLVMPTGAGKSLCYQLPAVVCRTSALIISPLIALMEDQVLSLHQKGLTAACIHTGKGREECRDILRAWHHLRVQFLFVSPERLGVPGFTSWLSRNAPGIIAIDEAHCISQWGHDFRADYRQLKERLRLFQNIPKIAMTATATAAVREDIVRQLELSDCKTYTAGFRRKNIHIDVVELPAGERLSAALACLNDPENRPAILYTPTRSEAERCASVLQKVFRTRAYHAGMPPEIRQRVQQEFMTGKTEVIVATVAFGMGIDKADIRTVIHMALPSALSGYYQEIGRAGRDGNKSRAILFYADSDNRTLNHLHTWSYPDPELLKQTLRVIGKGMDRREVPEHCPDEQGEVMLQKLLVHGAVSFSPDQRQVIPTGKPWESAYIRQKNQRFLEIQSVWDFASQNQKCRMLGIISYFGDNHDDTSPCGNCDICLPEENTFVTYRTPTKPEIRCLNKLWEKSGQQSFWSKSSLYQKISSEIKVNKSGFEALLNAMIRAGYLDSEWSEFRKGNRTIRYQQVSLPHTSIRKKPRPLWNDLKISETRLPDL